MEDLGKKWLLEPHLKEMDVFLLAVSASTGSRVGDICLKWGRSSGNVRHDVASDEVGQFVKVPSSIYVHSHPNCLEGAGWLRDPQSESSHPWGPSSLCVSVRLQLLL